MPFPDPHETELRSCATPNPAHARTPLGRTAGGRALVAYGILVSSMAAGGCGADSRAPHGLAWEAAVDTTGDTVVVHTLAGSKRGGGELVPELRIGALDGEDHEMLGDVAGLAVDAQGNVLIYDRQVPALRRYGPDGAYLGTIGGRGGGPGEYANSDGGLAVLTDGRIVLRDPGNARISFYDADGRYLESVPAAGGMFTATPVFAASDGSFYNSIFGGGEGMRLVRHGLDGAAGDTVRPPDRGVEPPRLTATAESMMSTLSVPFTPSAVWTFHPEAYFVSAVTDRYAIDLARPEGPILRIARDVEPVSVSREERAAEEERITGMLRRIDSSWRWTGPGIPNTKPIIRRLFAGRDGRIWVQLHQSGERVEGDDAAADPDGRPPPPRFREPTLFDVFEDDGRYLGQVRAPDPFSVFPQPVFRGDLAWAIERDELGVQYLVRYRIEWER